ncbi:hypothetical protein [Pseudomonas fitomaticsae]|uniref:Uncharacterized protein n=1 Tax=Pseudomonas fitomaticsae TaxID=2837969 RepID=A0ABY3Q9J7_9PSED|nr:hypothetical protein [Pseudomonas fitomaticsae]UFQ02796.1 hypothetical protein KJY40_14255 [Pseudomonas fitomaticsae]
MNNPASRGGPIVALALTPPYIPSQTYPIIHPVAHVGLSRLNYYADPKGLLVEFGPYQGQERNETGRIYLNGLPVPTPAQTTVDTTSPLEFLVPLGLLSDGINILKVSLQRQSGNEDSSELSVLHSLDAPAGNDTDPNPGNSLLNIDVAPKSIGPAEAAAGVKLTMSYPGMALYDLLTINYGGKTLTHQIVPTAQDPNPETKPVDLTFNTADFAHAPNNPQFIFKYNVISQIDDFSGTSSNGVFNSQEFWSKDCVVNVHLDWAELHEAILQEILGDNGDDPAIVDLGKMNGGPLWALIHLVNTIWQAGDECDLTFEALVNGVVTATHQVKVPVSQVPGQLSVDIPNAKVIPDSTVRVTYKQIRGGEIVGVSKIAQARVVGTGFPEGFEDWEQEPVGKIFPTGIPISLRSGLIVTTLRAATNGGPCALHTTPTLPELGKISLLIS